jgi:hypothetical protein
LGHPLPYDLASKYGSPEIDMQMFVDIVLGSPEKKTVLAQSSAIDKHVNGFLSIVSGLITASGRAY